MTSRDYLTLAENYRREYYEYNRLISRELLPSKKAKLRECRDECIKQILILYTQYKLQKEREEEKKCKQLVN